MSWSELVLRTVTAFSILLLLTRLMGKKQISQLTFFDYVTGIAIGSTAGALTTSSALPIGQGVLALVGWAGLTIIIGVISMKSETARVIFDSQPAIVIKHGELVADTLIKTRLNTDDLSMLLRKAKTFDIKEVEYAILEPNGELSVLKKPEYQNVTKKDMFIPWQAISNIPTHLVVDGKIVEKNLKELNLSQTWLENEIATQGYHSLDEVVFAELESDASLHIMKRNKGRDSPLH